MSSASKEDPPATGHKDDSNHYPPIHSAGLVAGSSEVDPQRRIILSPSIIPSEDSVVFKESSFFARNSRPLPSPAEVRGETERRRPGHPRNRESPLPLHYPHLGLTVKYGARVVVAEGQCLWAVRRLFGSTVPVPEVYGWTTDQGVAFVYMEHVPGETLESRWDQLSKPERLNICGQLRSMVGRIRSLEQPRGDSFIGNVARGRLFDIVFTEGTTRPVGPFPDVKAFHDTLVRLPYPDRYDPDDSPHPYRGFLPDDAPVVFTHGDLHRSNVMITPPGQEPRVLAIIDWCQSGWLPSYWEYNKACWTGDTRADWATKYIPLFLDRDNEAYKYWDYFLLKMGV